MTFPQFIKLLRTRAGSPLSQPDFVLLIIDEFIGIGTTNKKKTENGESINPLADKKGALGKIYRGNSKVSKADARIILSRFEKNVFVSFLSQSMSKDSMALLRTDMENAGVIICDNKSTEIICAEQLGQILL